MASLRIEYRAPDQLTPYPRNARTHSKKQIRQIAESVRQFGFTNPIIIDGECVILAGHGRAEAARLLGLTSIPCVRIDHMSPEQKRAYILADNKQRRLGRRDSRDRAAIPLKSRDRL
jgi:ParB-like chromosome segregation protein Spo0J